jgi:hypothetical protein
VKMEAKEVASAKRCEEHDLYFDPSTGCFRCQNGLAQTEAAPTIVPGSDPPPMKKMPFVDDIREIRSFGAPNGDEIIRECLILAKFLCEKNIAYGDSALNPVRILSKADTAEQIRVRMDDKLSRLVRGELAGEDAIQDLVGYYILLKIAEKGTG